MANNNLTQVDSRYFHWVEEQHDSRTGSPFMAGGARKYIRKWMVKVKDRSLGANIVCRAPGILPYAPYATEDGKEWDYQALAIDIRLEDPIDRLDGTHKIVVIEYSTEMPQGGPPRFTAFGMESTGTQNNPWDEPPHIEWDGEVHREARPKDLDGKAYLNGARTPLRPSPTTEVGRAILIYERNEASHNARKQIRYSFAVNSDTFLGEAPGTVMLYPPRAILKWRGHISYWRMVYKFRFNSPDPPVVANRQFQAGSGTVIDPATNIALGVAANLNAPLRSWQPKYLNCGFMATQSVWSAGPFFNRPIPIMRGAGAITEPALLTAEGREMKPDADGVWPDPNYLEFRDFIALPFTPLLVGGVNFPN